MTYVQAGRRRTLDKLAAIGAFVACALLTLVTPASPAVAAPGDDQTDIAYEVLDVRLETLPPNIAGLPTIFSAFGSGYGGDFRGVMFSYDFNGDGVVDLETDLMVAEYTYDRPGEHKATVTATDTFFHNTAKAETTFMVDPESVLGPPLFPAEGAPPLYGITLDRTHVLPGGTVTLTGSSDIRYAARLAPVTEDDPWLIPPAQEFGELAGVPAELKIDAGMKPGKYKLLVTGENAHMSAISLTVDSPAKAQTVTWAAALGAGGGSAAIAAAVSVFIRKRYGWRAQ